MANGVWTTRLSRWSLRLGVAALVIGIGGAFIAGRDLIPKLMGLYALLGGTLIALIGTIAGVIGLILNLRNKTGLLTTAVLGLLLSGGYAGFMASRAVVARGVPSIHDITTNLANPPGFGTLKLAADNMRGVSGPDEWRKLHAQAYSDLKPITLAKAPAAVIADAERLAKERGWVVAVADPAKGVMEATASVSLIRYQDDVVVQAMPDAEGKGSIVNMRSVSRIGMSDLGVNAKRIREFLAALAKG